jgi:ABC-type multidrug transport system ATPase subunit
MPPPDSASLAGAGKTTLLDVLANRKNIGKVEGTILLNGSPPDAFYHRYIGYVEQNDIHLPSQTVLEAVSFAARSRLPETMDDNARSAVVQRVLTLLDLAPIAGQQVGFVGGLNPEERK